MPIILCLYFQVNRYLITDKIRFICFDIELTKYQIGKKEKEI